MSLTGLLSGLDWPAFLMAMALIELTPGPNMSWLATLAARGGRRAGLSAVAGITAGLTIQLIGAVTGLAALIVAAPQLYEGVRWAGIGFMLFLAWEAWRETGGGVYQEAAAEGSVWRGLIANILNPKTFVFYLSMLSQFADAARGPVWLQGVILGSVHILVSVLVHGAIVLFGDRLGAPLRRYMQAWPVRLGFALGLVGLAAWMAVSTARR
jgi:threonine/homoserine/homoserine lactone efflux protein